MDFQSLKSLKIKWNFTLWLILWNRNISILRITRKSRDQKGKVEVGFCTLIWSAKSGGKTCHIGVFSIFASYVFLLLRYFADRWKKNSHSFSFTIYYIFHIFLTSYIFLLLKCFCWQMKKWATLLPSPPLAIVSDN